MDDKSFDSNLNIVDQSIAAINYRSSNQSPED